MDKKSILDSLWTARWYLKKGLSSDALPYVSKAIDILEGNPETPEEEPDRPDDPMPPDFEGKFTEPEFVVVRGVRFKERGFYKTPSGNFEGLVPHYTVSGRSAKSARAVVEWLAKKGYGCMVMDEDGKIYIPEGFDIFKDWNHHAGVSKWGNRTSVSQYFAGMEICCWGKDSKEGPFRESKGEANIIPGKYQAYTEAQEKSLVNFILWAKSKNPEFKIENVVGHDELRTAAGKHGDKQDPGASLSMTMPEFRRMLKGII